MKFCGLIYCYNEEEIIDYSIEYYLSKGIDIVVFDNESTDKSFEIIKNLRENSNCLGKIIDYQSVKTDGYEWKKILRISCEYMHGKLSGYDWILLIDADSFYQSPVKGIELTDFIRSIDEKNYNVINGLLVEFYPTEKDVSSIKSPLERLNYCKINGNVPWGFVKNDMEVNKKFNSAEKINTFNAPQYKIFKYHPSMDFYSWGGHVCLREEIKISPIPFIYLHYSWLSYEHGLKKIFKERKARFVERKKACYEHPQYLEFLPIEKDLVRDSGELQVFDINSIQMAEKVFEALLDSELKIKIGGNMDIPGEFWIVKPQEIKEMRPALMGLPETIIFLMSNYCNAKCDFCNQTISYSKSEIDFEKFKIMISNLPANLEYHFIFSGGGEPLLCFELFKIISHLNEKYPKIRISIRTNGLLINKYAKELSNLNIFQLEISVHSLNPKLNSLILGLKSDVDVLAGVRNLNKVLRENNRSMRKMLCPVVSRRNIKEVPEFVENASELEVDEIFVSYRRYFFSKDKDKCEGNMEDSLFYEKDLYDSTIEKAKTIARKCNILLNYDPLFNSSFKPQYCQQPWELILVDPVGNIFPCCGGEVWFANQVLTKKYYMGNLLKEHFSEIWNNEFYIKLRRTLSPTYKDCFVEECKECHRSLFLNGPNLYNSHFINSKI
jgi:radical SAM protein with 4Fe4S-binding SPASM domain